MKRIQHQKSEFQRSKETLPVTLHDGQQIQVAYQLKRGIAQVYWYYIQYPCGGWVESDIRAFAEVDEAAFLRQACSRPMLPDVVKLLATKSLSQIRGLA